MTIYYDYSSLNLFSVNFGVFLILFCGLPTTENIFRGRGPCQTPVSGSSGLDSGLT